MSTPPPPHVRAAFGAKNAEPTLIEHGPVWRCDDVALRQATNPAEASWVAQTLGDLEVPDLRVARPVRSSDGRYVVGGWIAFRYLPGRAEPRYDEVISASLRLHKATADLQRPRFLHGRADVFAIADRIAWGEDTRTPLAPDLGGRLYAIYAESRKEVALRAQVVHGDLFGGVLFDGDEPPAIMDFCAFHRPPEWAAAVVVVDAMAWGGADESLAKRWGHLPEWPQALLRALLFRLAVHALHPRSTPRSMRGLERAAHEIGKLI